MIEYKIISANANTGCIVVQYGDAQTVNIELPIDENNHTLTGDDLDLYIRGFIPTHYLDRLSNIQQNGIANFSDIEKLVISIPDDNMPF